MDWFIILLVGFVVGVYRVEIWKGVWKIINEQYERGKRDSYNTRRSKKVEQELV